MISSAYGAAIDLPEVRRRFAVGMKGANLQQLAVHAAMLGFSSRGLKLQLEELRDLRIPCILHWDMNHAVVLKRVRKSFVTILDPAVGERKLSLAEVSRHFTGVALELTPTAEFEAQTPAPRSRH